jgi:hypothetical protein
MDYKILCSITRLEYRRKKKARKIRCNILDLQTASARWWCRIDWGEELPKSAYYLGSKIKESSKKLKPQVTCRKRYNKRRREMFKRDMRIEKRDFK